MKQVPGYYGKTLECELVDDPESLYGGKAIAIRVKGPRGGIQNEVLVSGYGARMLMTELEPLAPAAD